MVVKNSDVASSTAAPGVERKIIATGGKMMTVEINFKKGAVGALHSHPHEQISYVVSGSFEVEIDGVKEIAKPGDSYYINPDVVHGVIALEDSVIIDVFTPQREDFLK